MATDLPYQIAGRGTGDTTRWRELLSVNPVLTVHTINGSTQVDPWNTGQTIQIPPSWDLAAVRGGTSAPALPGSPASPGAPPSLKCAQMSVVPGGKGKKAGPAACDCGRGMGLGGFPYSMKMLTISS